MSNNTMVPSRAYPDKSIPATLDAYFDVRDDGTIIHNVTSVEVCDSVMKHSGRPVFAALSRDLFPVEFTLAQLPEICEKIRKAVPEADTMSAHKASRATDYFLFLRHVG